MNLKNTTLTINLTTSLIVGLFVFSGCIEKEKFASKPLVQEYDEFPLDERGEDHFLNRQYGSNCFASPNCVTEQPVETDISTEFAFMRGQLVLKGPVLFQTENDQQWKINEHIKVLGADSALKLLASKSESAIHIFDPQPSPYLFFNSKGSTSTEGATLTPPQKPKILFQSRLGLPAHQFGDAGFCNLIEAENFIAKSNSPFLPNTIEFTPDSEGLGYNAETSSYIAETVIICGGLSLLNTHLTIEAKNVIFYNSHITVSADQELPTGLKIVTENLGYFGANIIETNLINESTGQKGSAVPTVEISVSGKLDLVESTSSPNNRFNDHFLNIAL